MKHGFEIDGGRGRADGPPSEEPREADAMASIRVSVLNASTVLNDDAVRAAVPALQRQVHEHFAPEWGVDADLTFVPRGAPPAEGSWWLTILDTSDQAGAL